MVSGQTLHCIRHNGTSRQADLPSSEKPVLLLACAVTSRLRSTCTENTGLPIMPRSPLLHLPLQGVCKRTSTGTATDARKKSGDFPRSPAGCKPSCHTVNLPSLCSVSRVSSTQYQALTAFPLSAGETVSDELFPDVSSAAPAPQAVNQYEQEVAADLHAHTRMGIPSDTS